MKRFAQIASLGVALILFGLPANAADEGDAAEADAGQPTTRDTSKRSS